MARKRVQSCMLSEYMMPLWSGHHHRLTSYLCIITISPIESDFLQMMCYYEKVSVPWGRFSTRMGFGALTFCVNFGHCAGVKVELYNNNVSRSTKLSHTTCC